MSNPTTKEIVKALTCEGRVVNCPVDDCRYNNIIALNGDILCALGALEEDAADMIERQAARIRELEASAQGWIPLKWRKSTPEEKELYGDEVYIADCKLPGDGDEILISRCGGYCVSVVEFCNDAEYGIGDSGGNDWLSEVDAWMPLPKGYQKPAEEVANEVN